VKALKEYDTNITIYDPWANPSTAKHEYGVEVTDTLPAKKYDAVVLAVAHDEFKELNIKALLKDNAVVFDVKGFLDRGVFEERL